MSSLDSIASAFSVARSQGRAALMPYFTLGFPDPETSLEIIIEIARSGADLIELGLPFSDPLADGPTIQHSTQVALENGTTTCACLEMVKKLRAGGLRQPLLLMGYTNPILAFGVEKFIQEACIAGADGLIIPDLPLEEAVQLEKLSAENKIALVYLVAPTTPPDRLEKLAAHSTGFVYIVSLTGVTGARSRLAEGLEAFLAQVRAATDKPLAVGFGISTPFQAAQVGNMADGVIVGSAVIDAAVQSTEPAHAVSSLIAELRKALIPVGGGI